MLCNSPNCTLISCIQVPNHTSTYTCSTLSPHSPAPRSLTGVLIIHTCILTHLHRVNTHLVPNHPHLSQPLHIPHSPFTRCLVSHFNGLTLTELSCGLLSLLSKFGLV